jgi:hypothetical protein
MLLTFLLFGEAFVGLIYLDRLFGEQIADVNRIVACLRQNMPQPSGPCRAVFDSSASANPQNPPQQGIPPGALSVQNAIVESNFKGQPPVPLRALHVAYFVNIRRVGATCDSGAAGEIAKVSQVFQPDGRLAASNSA